MVQYSLLSISMARTVLMVEEITTNLPQPSSHKMSREPNYEKTYKIHKILQENLSSVLSKISGGAYDHLGLALIA
eukprot:13436111-Ditylum_brightwellii.AAC.1